MKNWSLEKKWMFTWLTRRTKRTRKTRSGPGELGKLDEWEEELICRHGQERELGMAPSLIPRLHRTVSASGTWKQFTSANEKCVDKKYDVIPRILVPHEICPSFVYLFYHKGNRTGSWNLTLSWVQLLGKLKFGKRQNNGWRAVRSTSQLVIATNTICHSNCPDNLGFSHWRWCISLLTQVWPWKRNLLVSNSNAY